MFHSESLRNVVKDDLPVTQKTIDDLKLLINAFNRVTEDQQNRIKELKSIIKDVYTEFNPKTGNNETKDWITGWMYFAKRHKLFK